MAWPIPDIPDKKSLPPPKYWFWIMVLVLMLIAGTISSLWFQNKATYAEVLFYGAASKTGKEQLLVNQTPQQTGTLCLITRELYA